MMRNTVTAILAVVALLAAGCGSGESTAVAEETTSSTAPEATTTSVDDTTEAAPEASDEPNEDDLIQEEPWWPLLRRSRSSELAHLVGDIERAQGEPLPIVLRPGTYTTNQLGPPVTFTLPVALALPEENPGFVVFPRPGTPGGGSLLMTRPVGVFLGARSVDPRVPELGRLAASPVPENLAEWFEQVEAIEVVEQAQVSIGGADVTRYEIEIDDDLAFFCAIGTCVNALVAGPTIAAGITFNGGRRNVVWEVEQPGTDIVLMAKATEGDAADWFEVVNDVVASIDIGEPVVSPIEDRVWDLRTQLPPGDYRFAGIDWLRFDVGQDVAVSNNTNHLEIAPIDANHVASIARVVASPQGEPVATVDELRTLLIAVLGADAVEEIGSESILGQDAVTLRVAGGSGQPLFYFAEPIEGELWESAISFAAPDSKLWIIERPDGIWAAMAEWFDPSDETAAQGFADSLFSQASLVAE